MKRLLAITAVVLGVVGCADNQQKSESRTYDLELNGCKTGKHEFGSLADMCKGLKDSKLNNGCALSMRREFFNSSGCEGAGVSWES